MKIGILILLVSTTGFAAASIVLTQRVRADRAEVAKVEEQRTQLVTRVKALEQERASLEAEVQSLRNLVSDPQAADQAQAAARREDNAVASLAKSSRGTIQPFTVLKRADANTVAASEGAVRVWNGIPAPEPTPAMRKMMRNQMKQSLRRQYEDAGAELGLDAEQSRKLIDLIADQHTRSMYQSWPADAEGQAAMRRKMEDAQRQQRRELANLIGDSKLPLFDEYQRSLPARSEVINLQEQLAAADLPMRPEQRKALTAGVLEEGRSYPRPEYSPGLAPEDFRAQMNEWEEQHQQRLLDNAEKVLNSEQLAVFRDYQEYHREMRKQFSSMLPPPVEGTVDATTGAVTNSITFAPAVSGSFSATATKSP
jgi:cell division protein FtsB